MERLILDVKDVVAFERAIAEGGVPLDELMRRAGLAVANAALAVGACGRTGAESASAERELDMSGVCGVCQISRCAKRRSCGKGFPFPLPRVAVLAGAGNNGGDGWTAAEVLADAGCEVVLFAPCEPAALAAEPARGEALRVEALRRAGSLEGLRVVVDPDEAALRAELSHAGCVVDAMLGIGFAGGALREPFATWAACANEARAAGARVVAADVPSGLSAQTGRAALPTVRADVTVTMIAAKPGLLAPEAAPFTGRLVCANLNLNMRSYRHLVSERCSQVAVARMELFKDVTAHVNREFSPAPALGGPPPLPPAEQAAKRALLGDAIRDGLGLEGARRKLAHAGFELERSSKADLVAEFFLARGERSIAAVNVMLYAFAQPLL